VLTGMTTIARADTELMDMTIGRELGIGGVLLTPEPGRLNSATEPFEELATRQRELRIVDGLYYKSFFGKNRGPEYVSTQGNAVFARFKIPVKNAKDAMAFFVEYIARGEHNVFGSLLNRPSRGTGAGCTPFAVSWLEAAGVIPFAAEPPELAARLDQPPLETASATDFWLYLHRTIYIPWGQIGCDERLGVDHVVAAQYTIYDLLFHNLSPETLRDATEGLAGKIKRDYGFVAGTLFQFGAMTPVRDLVINAKRKDPRDAGDYGWGKPGEGLLTSFWDNSLFSAWVKSTRERAAATGTIVAAQDGRFNGILFDAMAAPRQSHPFFAEADMIDAKKRQLAQSGTKATSCEDAFRLGVQ
jgi:hypothetical protein